MEFGRIITSESYFKGELKSSRKEYEESKLANNKADLVTEVLRALDLVVNDVSPKVTIEITPVKEHYMRVVKKWTVE